MFCIRIFSYDRVQLVGYPTLKTIKKRYWFPVIDNESAPSTPSSHVNIFFDPLRST